MRTVTFSNEKVAKAVNKSCLSTWINRNPKFHNCEFKTEERIVKNSYEMYVTKNFCTFFVTPDLKVLHYISGYYNPEFFLEELKFVNELRKEVCDEKGIIQKDKYGKYAAIHRLRAEKHKESRKLVQKAKPPSAGSVGWDEFKKKQESLRLRKMYVFEGLQYLSDVSTDLRAEAKKGSIMPLTKVLKGYRGGNEFTEEK